MIAEIDRWLDQWAAWRRGDTLRLGISSRSPIHRMMRETAETSKSKYRKRRYLLISGGVLIERHTDAMRCVETAPSIKVITDDNPRCEMMDRAVCALPHNLGLLIKLKYGKSLPDEPIWKMLRLTRRSYYEALDRAHYALEGWLRGHYGEKAEAVIGEISTAMT